MENQSHLPYRRERKMASFFLRQFGCQFMSKDQLLSQVVCADSIVQGTSLFNGFVSVEQCHSRMASCENAKKRMEIANSSFLHSFFTARMCIVTV